MTEVLSTGGTSDTSSKGVGTDPTVEFKSVAPIQDWQGLVAEQPVGPKNAGTVATQEAIVWESRAKIPIGSLSTGINDWFADQGLLVDYLPQLWRKSHEREGLLLVFLNTGMACVFANGSFPAALLCVCLDAFSAVFFGAFLSVFLGIVSAASSSIFFGAALVFFFGAMFDGVASERTRTTVSEAFWWVDGVEKYCCGLPDAADSSPHDVMAAGIAFAKQ